MIGLLDAKQVVKESFDNAITPDPLLLMSEWSDEYRRLSSKASAEPGHWRTVRTPYLKEIMDCLSPSSPITRVVFMKGTQLAGTECGLNFVGFISHLAPGPMLVVQPTVDMSKRMSVQRLAEMIEATPVLKNLFKPARERDSGNTILSKDFPGGVLILTGANSAVGLRSMPVRYLFLDEVDAYPADVDGEGDPVSLAEKRTTTFSTRRKIYVCSTPTIRGFSRIEREYESSDQRKYYVPCPHCKELQVLQWSNIKFKHDDKYNLLGEVVYECKSCKASIEEYHKTWMLENGKWIAKEISDVAGFHLSSLYSPIGWKSWKDIVLEFLKVKKTNDKTLLKTWVNTILAETWEEEAESISDNEIYNRRENYGVEVPSGVILLTASADIQEDRIEILVNGWGLQEESWAIEHEVLYGDTANPDIYIHLDNFLVKTYTHAYGYQWRIVAATIDTGYRTKQVYDFVRPRQQSRNIFAVKGANTHGMPIVTKPSINSIPGIHLYHIGVDAAKDLIYGRLRSEKDKEGKKRCEGPGYMHYPLSFDEDYFKQLTAEKVITKYKNGIPYRVYVKDPGRRNEALDLTVYNVAALLIYLSRTNQKLERIAESVQAKIIEIEKKIPAKQATQGRKVISKGIEI